MAYGRWVLNEKNPAPSAGRPSCGGILTEKQPELLPLSFPRSSGVMYFIGKTQEVVYYSSSRSDRTPMERRTASRIRVHFRSFFSGSELEGDGTVIDLSTKGCKVASDTSVEPVTELEVWFFLPDHERPIKVQLAEVRWTKGREFGVEFLHLRTEEQERLSLLVKTLETEPRP